MGAGPRRPARPQAACRHPPHAGAGRRRARRPARARRDRLHDDRQQSAGLPARLAKSAPPVSQLSRGGEDYYRRTKIYPIMHTVVIRNDVYERNPWVALSMYKALCRAKDHAYHLLADMGSPKVSSAWLQPLLEEERAIFGPDWFAYGIEPNRPSIEALLQYTHEHGLTDRRVKLEELFAPSTMRDIPLSEGQHV